MKNTFKHDLKGRTILLTGAGGPAPAGMISILRNYGARIITVDMQKFSPAFYLSDKSYLVPRGDSPEFLHSLSNICKKESVDALISIVDEELIKTLELETPSLKVIQPRLDFTKICLDKLKCMDALLNVGISCARSFLLSDIKSDKKYPLFLKPRVGRGSRGIGLVNSEEELNKFIKSSIYSTEELIVQPYIPGDEYTVSVVAWRDGTLYDVIPKKIVSKVGVTKIAVTERNKLIIDLCKSIQDNFRANGPFNVQLKLDKDGKPVVFEINPRFSTSTTLTIAAGFDELGGLLQLALAPEDFQGFGSWEENVVMIRHTSDQFMSLDQFKNYKIL